MAGIFKAYDIRGVVGEGLDTTTAYGIGRGLGKEIFCGEGPIVVSRDMRTHSPELSAALINGLNDAGCDVIDVGLAATPMNYWANVEFKSRGSVTVTASHNGAEYNGFKVSGANATPLDYSTGLDKVEAFVRANSNDVSSSTVTAHGATTVETGCLDKYLDFMDTFINPGNRTVKIAVDAANGMAGFFLEKFISRHSWLKPVPLYWELDGSFPNHEADPLKPENLRALQTAVKENGCDFGVAFDGDADRCMFVDETGEIISSDLITALIAAEVLKHHPGTPILYDLRSSRVVPEWIEAHGGVPVRGRVGHSYMKRLLKSEGAFFGGELSGHYYFADCFSTDSGLMAMIQVINIWQQRQNQEIQPMSKIVEPLRRYSATGEINFHVSDVSKTIASLEKHYETQGARLDYLDGLTVERDGWWFNLRSSNTEPLLRLNLEAGTPELRSKRFEEVKALIEQHP